MRYVCPICGYIYDEAAEGVPFDSLPDSWGCPLCGAPKLMFEPEAVPEPPNPSRRPPPLRPATTTCSRFRRARWPPSAPTWPAAAKSSIKRKRPPSSARSRTFTPRPPPRRRTQPRGPGGAVPRRPGQRLSRPERRRHRPGGPGHPAHLRLGRKGDPNALRPAGPLSAGGRSLPPGHPGVGVLGLRVPVHRGHAPRAVPCLQSARMEI